MSLLNKARRLLKLEKAHGYDEAELCFEDGSTRVMKVSRERQKRLELLIAAMGMARYSGDKPPEKPRDITKHEASLQLLGHATEIKTDEKTLRLTHNMARYFIERQQERQQKAASDATPEGRTAQSTETQ